MADPQIAPVLLKHETHRIAADLDVGGDLPDCRVDHGDFISRRKRHEQGARIAPHHPILAGAVEWDQRDNPLAAVPEQRINDGDAGLAVERQDVPGIEVDVRPIGQPTLEEVSNLLPTRAGNVFRLLHADTDFLPGIDPHTRRGIRDRSSSDCIGDLESDFHVLASDDLVTALLDGTYSEIDADAV